MPLMPRSLAAAACLAALLLPAACTGAGTQRASSRAGSATAMTATTATTAMTGTTAEPPETASSGPTVSAGRPASHDAATDPAADFEHGLREQLRAPAVPSFAIPTDLLSSAQDRDIADRLRLQPGLYEGIAVLGARCDGRGAARSVDAGPRGRTEAAGGSYRKGAVSITVKPDGTGIYNASDLHVAVLGGGAGVYEDGDVRLAVQRGGAGTYTDATRRLTVRADGSGSYTSGATRLWIGPDGAGGYSDGTTKASVGAGGAVSGRGESARLAAIARVVRDRLPRFAPVPAIRRVTPTGRACGTVIRLDANVLFDFGSSGLRADSRAMLDRVAALLRVVDPQRVQVNGYTDAVGSATANLDLSRSRAVSVRAALVQRSVPPETLTARGLGEGHPVRRETTRAGADDPAARQLNRRVEIVLPNR
jgi:OOP family OmpA-OmpF porin